MNNNQTLEKMKQMRLFGMHDCFRNAVETGVIHDYTAEEFIAHLIEAEDEERNGRKTQRLIKNAHFRFIAQLEDISYTAERNLTKKQIAKISELRWLERGENIIITGLTGTGKTFLSSAIGLKACLNGYRVEYFPMNKLFHMMKFAKSCGNYLTMFQKLVKKDLIIIDDFGLEIMDKESRMSFFEILEERSERKSMVISSQIPVENWYDIIGEKTLADAICDRLISSSQFIDLKGESMRRNKREKS